VFSDVKSEGGYESDDDDEFDEDNINDDGVNSMVDDLEESGQQGPSEPNFYAKIIEEAKRDLYKECSTTTRLSFIINMLHINSYNHVTNRAFDQFMSVLCATLPKVSFPKSYADATSVLFEVGLGYEKIHECKFDCALFWGD
jgi:hypothetical protein